MSVYVNLCGGLGNQLFQIANGYAYSLRYGKKCFFSETWPGIKPDRPSYWDSLFINLKAYLLSPEKFKGTEYKEPTWSYHPIPWIEGDVILTGYFQSEKYFDDYSEEVRRLLKIEVKPISMPYIAVHIRRGDYFSNTYIHSILNKSYYESSKQIIQNLLGYKPICIYFTDDKEWVKQNFKEALKEGDILSESNSDVEDFKRMIQCKYFILGNSTFSWWASWLNESVKTSPEKSIITAPVRWFGPGFPDDWSSIYRRDFILVQESG